MGNCLAGCCPVDGSTLEHPPPKNSTADTAATAPENSTPDTAATPPENATPVAAATPLENSTPDTTATPSDWFDVHGEDDLKRLLDYIDQTLQARRSATATNGASETITSKTKSAATLLLKVADRCKSVVNSDISQEAYQILTTTLGTLGNLHWITAGLSIVALILERIDMTVANLEEGLKHLETLLALGRHVIKLYPQLPENDDALRRATSFIAEGAITCCTHLASGSLKRFALANENTNNFAALEKHIPDIHQDLLLACDVELLQSRTSMPLAPTVAEYPDNAVGLDEKVSKVLEMLRLEGGGKLKSGVQAVDLHGIGGIGKSFLGTAVHAKLPSQDRSHVRVEVGENPSDEKICMLQKQMLERILNQKVNFSDCTEGRQKLKQYLKKSCKHPYMFFIDNIFHPNDLDKLLPDHLNEVLPDGSRIIITSRPHSERISQVLSKKGVHCEKYDVTELDNASAQALLCREIFSSTTFPFDKVDKGKRILKLCGGIPLALEVVGRYLREQKDDETWDVVIEDLNNCRPLDGSNTKENELTRTLEFGYNKLSPEFQIAFLDVACLLRGENWEIAKSFKRELVNLEKWGLVKKPLNINQRTGDKIVVVHDLLVALARRKQQEKFQALFPKEAAQHPEFVPRIRVGRLKKLPFPLRQEDDEILCMLLEGIIIKGCNVPIPAEKLNAMQTLRLLILENVVVHGNHTNISKRLQVYRHVNQKIYTQYDSNNSTYVIGQLPTGCQHLHLVDVGVGSSTFLSTVFSEKSSLRSLIIKRAIGLKEIPKGLGGLAALHTLDLQYCQDLTKLPNDLGRWRALRSLSLDGCEGLLELPKGFGGVAALQILSLRSCRGLTKLPDDFGSLGALRFIYLEECEGLLEFPKGFGELTSLETLSLDRCRFLTKLSDDFGNLGALQFLYLDACKRLLELPKGFGGLAALKTLSLQRCRSLTKLPDDFGSLGALQFLDLEECEGILELPKGFGGLAALKKLSLRWCRSLTKLPEDFGSLSALQSLNLNGCGLLLELPKGFGELTALQDLHLEGCKSLTKLSEDFGSLGALESLYLEYCEGLLELPKGFGRLASLKKLGLSRCTGLTKLCDDFGSLGALQYLHLGNCEGLLELPKGFGGLAALDNLSLWKCTGLTKLPNDFGSLGALQDLVLKGCEGLLELPKGFGELVALQDLQLEGCKNLLELPKGFGELTALKKLSLERCRSPTKLSEDFGSLGALESLCLDGCEGLLELPMGFGRLAALLRLGLRGCTGLTKLCDDFGSLGGLQDLVLDRCEGLLELPKGFGELASLQDLWFQGCKSLTKLSEDFGSLGALESLYLDNCEGLLELPKGFGGLAALQTLKFRGCTGLTELCDDFGSLGALQNLYLDYCEGLLELPEGFGGLAALKKLSLRECTGLTKLPNDFGSLGALEDLVLNGCEGLLEHSKGFGELAPL